MNIAVEELALLKGGGVPALPGGYAYIINANGAYLTKNGALLYRKVP